MRVTVPRLKLLEVIAKFGISLVVVVVVQGILAYKFRVFSYFDLPLICTVYYGFTMGNPIASIAMGSSLGLMQDSLSAAVLGTNGFSKTVIGFLAASAVSKFAVDQAITRIFALFLFTLGDGLLVTMVALMTSPPSNATYSGAIGGWLLSATFNTLLGLLLFGYRDRLNNATA
jgi:rod shape-determining protein MreD